MSCFCMLFWNCNFSYSFFYCKMNIDIIGKLNEWTLFTYKSLFRLFPRKAEIWQTWKINASWILSSSAKICWVYTIILTYILLFCIDLSTKPYRGLRFNQTHLPLFQKMSVKIYTNLFLSSEPYNFKTNYLNDKLRHGMWVHILVNNLMPCP